MPSLDPLWKCYPSLCLQPKKRKDDMTEDEAREALQSASDLQSVLQDIKEAVAKDNRRGQEKTDLSGTAKKTPGMHCCVTDCK